MNSIRYKNPKLNNLEKIKYLADEMAKRSTHINDGFKEDYVFHKIIFVQSVKHKSIIFNNRKKKKLLKYFSLNKVSSEDIKGLKCCLENKDRKSKKRKSTIDKRNMDNRNIYKNFALHFSLKNQNKNYNDNDQNNDNLNSNSYSETINDNYEYIKDDIRKHKENQITDNDINNFNQNSDESDNYIDSENYEIKYVNPKEVKIIYDKENSPIINGINNNALLKNNRKDKGRNFFDKEMKLLKLKNNKIEKKRQNLENKNKKLFHVSQYLDKNSMKIVKKNPDYKPIVYKSLDEHLHHLVKIQINQNRINSQKINEENKEIEEILNYNKLNKRIFSQSNWEEFIEQENCWQEEKKRATEVLRDKIENEKKFIPTINKNSIIITEKINNNINNNNNYYISSNNNIFNKLYNDQEKYDNKLKMKRQESMPSFWPKTNKNKKKLFKGFNNNDKIYKNFMPINKSITNNKNKHFQFTKLDNKNKKPSINHNNNKQNILKIDKNRQTPEIMVYKNIIPKTPSISTKEKIKNKKQNNINNISFEYQNNKYKTKKPNSKNKNINNNKNNYKNKNKKIKDQNLNKSVLSLFEIDKNNNLKKIINNKHENENKKSNNDINKYPVKYTNKEEAFDNEELNDIIRNISYKNENNKINEKSLLYNLNIRDNTSNTIKENIVLTTNKYIEFFKLTK